MAIATLPVPPADPAEQSIFEIDSHLHRLLEAAEEEAAENNGQVSAETAQAIVDYIDALGGKADRIADYIRSQEARSGLLKGETERLQARKKAADNRVQRLKEVLRGFFLCRGIDRLEGERNTISLQRNSTPSLVIAPEAKIPGEYYEADLRFTWTEFRALVFALPEGSLRATLQRRLDAAPWEVDTAAVKAAVQNGVKIAGVSLVKGQHIRLR
jgi:hypothetical protein